MFFNNIIINACRINCILRLIQAPKEARMVLAITLDDGGNALNSNLIYDELALRIDKNRPIINAPMKEYTTFKAGGNAALLVLPDSAVELSYALKVLDRHEAEHLVIGNGSNLLVKDSGYRGVILRIGEPFQQMSVMEDRIEAGAGVLLSSAAQKAQTHTSSSWYACHNVILQFVGHRLDTQPLRRLSHVPQGFKLRATGRALPDVGVQPLLVSLIQLAR
jgi:hypothetical protein